MWALRAERATTSRGSCLSRRGTKKGRDRKGWLEALRVERQPSRPDRALLSLEKDWAWREADRSSGGATGLGIEEEQPEMMKRTLSQNLHSLVELPGKPLQPEGTV
ncbi:hypothetical protein E2C01_088273 [Portunus trituberculatus]|uniref:Uncharacterized protein n=1 Tax=Portunus trituberculatus TaxID=210409 RepID=A0A5B7J5P6_PORTR|nr:hypothetical protein [Portunus trituberculatus]